MKTAIRIPSALLLILFMLPLSMVGQTFEEYVRQREAEFQQFKREYEEFIQQMQQQYEDYVIRRDQEFTEYLNQRWEEYQVFTGAIKEEKPKPAVMPAHDPSMTPEVPRTLPAQAPDPEITARPPATPDLPAIQKPEPERFPTRSLSFMFYGNRISLTYDPAMFVQIPMTIDNESISQFWSNVSGTNYNHLVNQLGDYSRQMNLNDWGYYLLVKNFSDELFSRSPNGATLMAWFLMNRSGYRAKAAYYNNRAMLMLPSMHEIYEVPFQVFDGIRFYLVQGDAPQLYTYENDFPDAPRVMDMTIQSPLNLGDAVARRNVSFEFGGETYDLSFEYCRNTIDFYADYPQSQIHVYFDSAVSPLAQESLAENLMPLIHERDELSAASLLLRFTQTAFDYKTDDEQFGYEKFFFAEEVLHYPYSDCEDRSVLFAYLVRELLNLKVIGLEYYDHIATAVNYSVDPGGDYIMFNDEKYTVSDPTFINAPIGMTMPKYADVTAVVIEIDDSQHYGDLASRIWEKIYAAGGHRGGNRNDMVFDSMGNAYATGFFRGSAQFGNTRLRSMNESNGAFLVKYGFDGTLKWARQPDRQFNTTAYHLALDHDNNVYFSGTYNDQITFRNTTLTAHEQADVFLAKYSSDGDFLWAEKAGVDTLNTATQYMFVARYNQRGRHLGTDVYMENPDYNGYGISIGTDGTVFLAGSSFANTGLSVASMAFETAETFDPIRSLKEENDRLIAEDYDRAIAGLFAAINLIKLNNVVIPGTAAQQALDRYNPGFKRRAPTVYNAIANINFLKNDQGVVLITTEGGGNITIDYLRIRNNASIKVTEFSNGNTQLDVLSGLQVGRAFVWYDLNFVRLLRHSGDLLFDFSRNNTQRTFNLEKDIFY
ncbi:MAG: hypothetical protein RG741_02880 [Bacteroidales bacterium]|nr:hypothetical protein [Bacteroidales bacterium]